MLENERRAGMMDDMRDGVPWQPDIHGHRNQPCPLQAPVRYEVLQAGGRCDGNPIPRLQPEGPCEARCQSACGLCQLAVGQYPLTVDDGRFGWELLRRGV